MRHIRQPEDQQSAAGLDRLAPPGDLENGRLLAWAQHFRHDGEHPSGTVLVMGAPAADPLPYAVWTAYTVDRGDTWTCMQGIYHRSLPVAWEAFTGRASWGVLAIGAGDECETGTCELGHGCVECPDWPHAGHPDCACIYDGLGGGGDGGGRPPCPGDGCDHMDCASPGEWPCGWPCGGSGAGVTSCGAPARQVGTVWRCEAGHEGAAQVTP